MKNLSCFSYIKFWLNFGWKSREFFEAFSRMASYLLQSFTDNILSLLLFSIEKRRKNKNISVDFFFSVQTLVWFTTIFFFFFSHLRMYVCTTLIWTAFLKAQTVSWLFKIELEQKIAAHYIYLFMVMYKSSRKKLNFFPNIIVVIRYP